MKKIIYIFAIMLFALVSCDKEEVSIHAQSTNELTLEEQKMRSALETTTNILIDMIVRDQTYFDELNKFIVAGSPNYMEG